jgi:hypothetical protein
MISLNQRIIKAKKVAPAQRQREIHERIQLAPCSDKKNVGNPIQCVTGARDHRGNEFIAPPT